MRPSDIYARVTNQIIAAIESGATSYQMPWHRWGDQVARPINAATGHGYRGINTLLLWASSELEGYSSGRWATYRQWTAAGAQVRKGEKATPILFWKTLNGSQHSAANDDVDSPTDRGRFVARTYFVFNEDQVDGAPPRPAAIQANSPTVAVASSFIGATGVQIRHGGDRAYYAPSIDQVWLPQPAQFRDEASYYAVLGHECVHWTGAKHRLDRQFGTRFGDDAYAFEELVAELGSAFLSAHLGLSVEPRPDHATYIASWLKVLKADPKAIQTAAARAQQAVDYLNQLSAESAERRVLFPAPEQARTG